MDQESRRNYFRINFDRHVDMEFAKHRYDGCQIRDLSLNGMFVAGNFKQQESDPCLVNLVQKSKTTELRLQALAKVVRQEDLGLAVEFTSMTFDSYMYLQTLLLNHNENLLVMAKMLAENCPFHVTEELPAPQRLRTAKSDPQSSPYS
jgi:hypothetical protein